MRIVFIRHGDPNYEKDCLTPLGKKEALVVAKRLKKIGTEEPAAKIKKIYSSPLGRARQTADAAAKILRLDIETLDYMKEISWSGDDLPCGGHPWTLSGWLVDKENFDFAKNDWRTHPYFKDNQARLDCQNIAAGIDQFLSRYGYRHEGNRLFCERGTDETVAIFAHGGSIACVFAHLMGMPLPYALSSMFLAHTSISVLNFPSRPGEWIHPILELFNDAAHIIPLTKTKRGIQVQEKKD
jgi:probable phosphoglycerate mutase